MSRISGVQLDNEGEYFTGGSVITGRIVLDVEKERLSLRDFKMRMICDVDSSTSVQKAKTDHAPSIKTFKTNIRIYDESSNMQLKKSHFDVGRHEIPFSFRLPPEGLGLPPSVTTVLDTSTYGSVTYRLKAHLKKGVSSWFASADLKGAVQFLYMPSIKLDPSVLDNPELRNEPFNELLEGATKVEKGLLASVFSKKPREEPPLELKGIFCHPSTGLVQHSNVPLKLNIQPGDPSEQITVKSLSLHLETVLVVAHREQHISHIVKSDPLMQSQLIRSGNVLDLSDLVSKNEVPSTLAPSFETPVMSFHHQFRIEILLSRRSSTAMMKFTHRIPCSVLSPFLNGARDIVGNPNGSILTSASKPESSKSVPPQPDYKNSKRHQAAEPAPDVKGPALPERRASRPDSAQPNPASVAGPSHPYHEHEEEYPTEAPPDYQETMH